MAPLHMIFAVALFTIVSADLDIRQQRPNPALDVRSSSAPDTVRPGLISAEEASDFRLNSTLGSSGSSNSEFISTDSDSTTDGSSSNRSSRSTRSSGSYSPSGPGRSGVSLSSSQNVDSGLLIEESLDSSDLGDVTITQEITVDVFKTVTNVIYNSVPITLTEFMKTTAVRPTFLVLSTPVDDEVFVVTAPVTRTDSVTVTNTNTGYSYFTEISTDVYTISHKAYAILQKTLTSTLQQTKVFRPTVVRTRINTEYDTQTVEHIVTNTVVIQPRSNLPFGGNGGGFNQRVLVNQPAVGQRSGFVGNRRYF